MPPTLTGMGRPKKKEKTEPLRIPESVVRRIRRIASHRGQDPGDYVADHFGATLDKHEKEMIKDIEKEQKQDKEGG